MESNPLQSSFPILLLMVDNLFLLEIKELVSFTCALFHRPNLRHTNPLTCGTKLPIGFAPEPIFLHYPLHQ
jgi:hypothetical protein